jgi:hypothetical protein
MKQTILVNEYYVGSDILIICEAFADAVLRSNEDEYAKRKQFNVQKIKNDIVIGKLAEWGVYMIYLQRGRLLRSCPDMSLYSKEQKSFDPDLNWGLFNLHIKAQTAESALRYGDSWIFQSKDPLFGFSNEYDIVVGCRVSIDNFERGALVEIKLEKSFKNIVFGETKLSKFSGNKKAIYLKDNNG